MPAMLHGNCKSNSKTLNFNLNRAFFVCLVGFFYTILPMSKKKSQKRHEK